MHESMNLTASDSKPNYCISMSIISRFGDSLPPLRCTYDLTAADGKQHLTNPYMPKLYLERYIRLDRVQRKRDKIQYLMTLHLLKRVTENVLP